MNTKWSIKIIPGTFSFSLSSASFSKLSSPPSFSVSLSDCSAHSQSVINCVFSSFHYFHSCCTKRHFPDIFPETCTFLLLCLQLSFTLFSLVSWALFVNVQRRRMREQIMKHRSAFHTLFRKNSPRAQRMSVLSPLLAHMAHSIATVFG